MHRRTALLLSAALLLLPGRTRSDERPDSVMLELSRSEPSPNRDFLEEHYMFRIKGDRDSDYPHEVWLVDATDVSKRKLLYKHGRHVELQYSEDEQWIAINDHIGSNESRVILFKRKAKLDYAQVADITDDAWAFLMKETGHKSPPSLDHSYLNVMNISGGDQPVLLLHFAGHLDRRNHVDAAFCLYDVTSKQFSTDLSAFNRKHVVQE